MISSVSGLGHFYDRIIIDTVLATKKVVLGVRVVRMQLANRFVQISALGFQRAYVSCSALGSLRTF
jgi:hypothetical protein